MTTKVLRSVDGAQSDFATVSATEVGADATGAAATAQTAAIAAAATDATTKANAAQAAAIAASVPTGTAVLKSLVTTKGDTIAASASATPVRVPGGVDGQVYTADSTQTAGVAWKDILTVSGASGRASCRVATAAVLSGTPVYANGTAGVGATLTEVGFGALTVDGVAVAVNDRILVKTQADAKQNGIYVQSVLGTGLVSYVLTRATDYDQSVDIFEGTFTVIEEGTANANTVWQQTTSGTITPGTSSIVFATLTPTAVTRASLGLATSDTPQFAGIEVGAASDTTLARSGAGDLTVEGNALYRAGGTDVPVADGGTGASTAADARTNLGLGTLATQSGTFSGTSSGTNTGDQTIPVGGTPAVVLGTANTAGSSPNFLRRDDTILAFDATTPAAVGTAAVGAATTTARRDHVHATGAGTPTTQAFGDAAATGSGPAAAMTDHKHGMMAAPTSVSGNAGTVTTNANLTGDVTSVGNATTAITAVRDKWTEIVKSADQTVTNSAALVDDSELVLACVSGGVYHVEIFAIMSANDATGDFKYEIALPTASGWRRNIAAFGGNSDSLQVSTGVQLSATTAMFAGGVQQGGDVSDTPRTAYFEMMFRAGATASLKWQFAEFSAQAAKTATTRAGSVLRYRRLL